MSDPLATIRRAVAAGVVFTVRGHDLHLAGSEPGPELVAAIRADKPAIVAGLRELGRQARCPNGTACRRLGPCRWYLESGACPAMERDDTEHAA